MKTLKNEKSLQESTKRKSIFEKRMMLKNCDT